MKYKVHWIIDGLVDVEETDLDKAENLIKNKIEKIINDNAKFFEDVGAKAFKVKLTCLDQMKQNN